MFHLNDKKAEKRLPKYKALIEISTSEDDYKFTIRATFFHVCMMVSNPDWVVIWMNTFAPKAQKERFSRVCAETIYSTKVTPDEGIAEDVRFGLQEVCANITWTNDSPLVCGSVSVYRLKRFWIASILYTSVFQSRDIRNLVKEATIRAIISAYGFPSEDSMTWSFSTGPLLASCQRLKHYFRNWDE